MKKIVWILMLGLLPLSVQAKSVKLGNEDAQSAPVSHGGEKVCTSHDQCKTGLCKDGKCVYCDEDNACPTGKTCLLGMCKEAGACNRTSDCEGGYKCVEGACQVCLSGEKGCNCGEVTVANGKGGCSCPFGQFKYGDGCAKYCDFTACLLGYEKVEKEDSCCCRPEAN